MTARIIPLNPATVRLVSKRRRSSTRAFRSDLELVPRRRSGKGKLASVRLLAVDFKPWRRPGPTVELMHGLGMSSRIAAGIVQQPKKVLMKLHEDIGPGQMRQIISSLLDSAERMKFFAHMIEVANDRLAASADAVFLEPKSQARSRAGRRSPRRASLRRRARGYVDHP